MNPDIAVQFSTPYHVIKTSCNKNFLACCTNINNKIIQYSDLESDHNGSFLLKPSPNLELLVKQFNNDTPENGKTSENIYSSKYYDITEMHNIKIPQKNKSLSLFHVNACSVSKSFDDIQHLLSYTKNNFDISERRITEKVSLLNNLKF